MSERPVAVVGEPTPKTLVPSVDKRIALGKTVGGLMGNARPNPDRPGQWETSYRQGDQIVNLRFAMGVEPKGPVDFKEQLAKALAEPGSAYFAVTIRRALGVTEDGNTVINQREAIVEPHYDDQDTGIPGYFYFEETVAYDKTGAHQTTFARPELAEPDISRAGAKNAEDPLPQPYDKSQLGSRFDETMDLLTSLTEKDEIKEVHEVQVYPSPDINRVIREAVKVDK